MSISTSETAASVLSSWLGHSFADSGRLCAALRTLQYNDLEQPLTKYLALNPNAKFVP
jgi:hypothetical protein